VSLLTGAGSHVGHEIGEGRNAAA